MPPNNGIQAQIAAFKRKYYINKTIKGLLIWCALVLAVYLLINTLEFAARFNEIGRAFLFFGFILSAFISAFYLFIKHLIKLRITKKQISDQVVAEEVGKFFPEVADKLLNLLQLQEFDKKENQLLAASIKQKEKELFQIPFVRAIDLQKNKKYLRYLLAPLIGIVIALVFVPQLITQSSKRIIQYNTAYVPEAPFSFQLPNQLLSFKNEPYTLKINTLGNSIPGSVFIIVNDRKIKTVNEGNGQFSYTFNNLDSDTFFRLEASSVVSANYQIQVVERPTLQSFRIDITYPPHTQRASESVQNSGNLIVPEGSNIKWNFETTATDAMTFIMDKESVPLSKEGPIFSLDSSFMSDFNYEVGLENAYATNKNTLKFEGKITKDQYPKITLDQYQDTLLYREIVLAGKITDDYGFQKLNIKYRYSEDQPYVNQSVRINPNTQEQTYYQSIQLDSGQVKAGAVVTYYLEVFDNDAVNGAKRSKTNTFRFQIPSMEDLLEEIDNGNKNVQKEIDQSIIKAQELQNTIKELDERLKSTKELDWQDKKLMEDLLKQKEELSKEMQKLQKENELNNRKQEQFQPQSDDIKQKMQQLQEIMENVLDQETKELYDELRELLEQQADIEEFRDQVEEINKNSQNLEKDLERTLELFKTLQFDMKVEEAIEEIKDQIDAQEQLQKKTESDSTLNQELAEEQSDLNQKTEQLKEQIEDLNQLNQDRENPDALPPELIDELEDVQEDQKKAEEALTNDEDTQEKPQQNPANNAQSKAQRQRAAKMQQRAGDKLKSVQESLETLQSSMSMEQAQEDMGNLRDLVDNLVTLSFNQENLMNDFNGIRPSDPRFVELSQEQLKIQNDSQIIQDSLVSLSQRVFQISSFVMKELNEMNRQMESSINSLKEKRTNEAIGNQQFTMTSINNLALLLDDVLQQMQEQMASSMNMGQGKDGSQKNIPMAGISELQQRLSEQIKELKQSGKTGRGLSEELARLASQQEKLRNALENFETGLEGNKLGEQIDRLIEDMEKNELDLLNKDINATTIERQQDIITRMLDAQNAMEQRGEDDKREAQTAEDYKLSLPANMQEYIKRKEQETQLLRTIPTKLNPYYKKESTIYFNKIKNKDYQ